MALTETYGIVEDYEEDDATPALDIRQIADAPNIADFLDDDTLDEIGMKVVREYDLDLNSRAEWEERMAKAMDLAMQVAKAKTYPWPNSANVQYPLITTGSIQFAARAYPAIVDGPRVAKARVVGYDPQGIKASRADRISQHMSWQLLDEMEEWNEDTDTLLHVLPIMGSQFKKTYFDKVLGRNVSELIDAQDLVMQYKAPWKRMPRKTQHVRLYPYEITERQRSGTFLKIEIPSSSEDEEYADSNDEDAPELFLEQHRSLDLDGDGYPEPYIVTVHKKSSKVVRILARYDLEGIKENSAGEIVRIEPVEYFTRYLFMPAPDGGVYGMGFGWLLHDINNTVNSTINQLLDSGHLANTGAGFIGRGLRIAGGNTTFTPGEFKNVGSTGQSIRDNIYQMQFPPPSPVLFNLLGLLIDAGKEISSVKDVLTGEAPKNAPATTTLAMVEQGMKVFTGIYKRIHRSLKEELKKLYRLNRLYLEPEAYFVLLDGQPAKIWLNDYDDTDLDIIPVSDPALASDMQRMAKAEFLYQLAQTEPVINRQAALMRLLEAGGIEEKEQLVLQQLPPDPKAIDDQQRTENDAIRARAGAVESQAKAALALAQADKAGESIQQEEAKLMLDFEKIAAQERMAREKNGSDRG